jgi:hypothetical protein
MYNFIKLLIEFIKTIQSINLWQGFVLLFLMLCFSWIVFIVYRIITTI